MRGYTLDDLLRTREFARRGPWDLSSCGGSLAIVLTEPSRREPLGSGLIHTVNGACIEANGSHILIADTSDSVCTAPFPSARISWAPSWSPDGKKLAAFVVMPDRSACLGLWDRVTDQITLIKDASVRPSLSFDVPQWTPDGRAIVARLTVPRPTGAATLSGPDVIVRSFDPDDRDADPNEPFLKREESAACLGIIDIESGKVTRTATGHNFNMARLSPDGHAAAFLSRTSSPAGGRSYYVCDLVRVILNTGEPDVIVKDVQVNSYGCRFSWSPDAKSICYVTGAGRHSHHLNTVSVVEKEPGIIAEVAPSVSAYTAPWWSPDGARLLWLQDRTLHRLHLNEDRIVSPLGDDAIRIEAVARRSCRQNPVDDHGGLLVYASRDHGDKYLTNINSESGEITELNKVEMSVDEFTFVASQDMAYGRGNDGPDEMLLQTRLGNSESTSLLQLNPWRREVVQPVRKTIQFEDCNGETQKAALFLPEGSEREPAPMIVTVYPGRRNSDWTDLEDEAQLLTGAGYAALYPDMQMAEGQRILQIVGVTLPAIDCAIETGQIDKDRIGVWGHSYGAYAVVALLTETGVFRTGIANGGSGYNMTSTFVAAPSTMRWCEFSQAGNGGTPWEKFETYIENSPFFRLDRVEVPLMLICGGLDQPASQSAREVFLALRRLGKRVEMREYRREQHVMLWSAEDTKDFYENVLAWFDRWMAAPTR